MALALPSALLKAVAPISPGYSGSGHLLDSAFSGGQLLLPSKIAHSHLPQARQGFLAKTEMTNSLGLYWGLWGINHKGMPLLIRPKVL